MANRYPLTGDVVRSTASWRLFPQDDLAFKMASKKTIFQRQFMIDNYWAERRNSQKIFRKFALEKTVIAAYSFAGLDAAAYLTLKVKFLRSRRNKKRGH